jgi:hypothetical protein
VALALIIGGGNRRTRRKTPLKVVQANVLYHTQYIGSSWSISYFDTIFLSFPKKTLKYGLKKG